MKLPPRDRCIGCGGILRSERWRCWVCVLTEQMYPTNRRN